MKKIYVSLLLTSIFLSPSAYGTLVDNGFVNPQNSALQANFNGTIIVGQSTNGLVGNGTFEVNASPIGNGLTAATSLGLNIGYTNGIQSATGVVSVIGNGLKGSARIDIQPGNSFGTLNIGNGNDGNNGSPNAILNISNGGIVEVHDGSTTIGLNGTALINISDKGSELISSRISLNKGTLNISKGGNVSTTINPNTSFTNFIAIGGETGKAGTINVDGAGAGAGAETGITTGNLLLTNDEQSANSFLNLQNGTVRVDNALSLSSTSGEAKIYANNSVIQADTIDIGIAKGIIGYTANGLPSNQINFGTVGQQAEDHNGNFLFYKDGSPILYALDPNFGIGITETGIAGNEIFSKTTGELIVDNNSTVVSQIINVSENHTSKGVVTTTVNNKKSILTVRNNSVVQSDVNINKDGVLNGDGTIIGNVLVNGGSIAPGNSPGILTIDGDLEIFTGMLDFEIGGSGLGQFDMLDITGDFIFSNGFDLNINFINGFLPQDGDTFDFLNVAGSFLGDLSLINLAFNSKPVGFDFRFDLIGDVFSITSTAQTSSVPTPSTVVLLVVGLLGFLKHKKMSL